jgi:hypothetical protein
MDVGYLLGRLTPFANSRKMIVSNQSTGDIIKQIIDTHNKYKADYDKISDKFWKGNVKNTCKYLFDFLKKNVVYSVEPDTRQSVKSPAAILATGQYSTGGNDCKHYSLFQAGILDSLKRKGKNIDWCYRFANYKLFSTTPHHVFVVVKINGKEYWCDPVLNYWDQKKPYINKIDKKMSLYSISGIGARRKAKRPKKRRLSKIALFPARKAYLALIRLNFRKVAIKLYIGLKNEQTKKLILEKWLKLGGNPNLLVSTVQKAWNKYKRKFPNRAAQIGLEPATTAAAVTWATAAPIIAAMAPILTLVAKLLPPGSKGAEILETGAEAAETYTADQEQQQETVGAINPYYLYGGLALAGYFLYKNKKKLFR